MSFEQNINTNWTFLNVPCTVDWFILHFLNCNLLYKKREKNVIFEFDNDLLNFYSPVIENDWIDVLIEFLFLHPFPLPFSHKTKFI